MAETTCIVMTWNIGLSFLNGIFTDNRCRDGNIAFIRTLIRNHSPHLVFLQELKGKEQLNEIARTMKKTYSLEISYEHFFQRYMGVLIKKGISYTFQCINELGKPLLIVETANHYFLGVHLDAFFPKRRLWQVERMLTFLKNKPKKDIVVCGDFNLSAIKGNKFILSRDKETYRLLTRNFIDVGKGKGQTVMFNLLRTDYIFTNKHKKDILDYHIIKTRGRFMDHFPIVSTLRLTEV